MWRLKQPWEKSFPPPIIPPMEENSLETGPAAHTENSLLMQLYLAGQHHLTTRAVIATALPGSLQPPHIPILFLRRCQGRVGKAEEGGGNKARLAVE